VEHLYNENLKEFETKMLMTGADPAWWADRFPKFENSKMVWNYRELITCMYRIDVRANHCTK